MAPGFAARPCQRARPLSPLLQLLHTSRSCSEAHPLPPALPPSRTERTHASPPSPPLILAPAARLTRHDSAPPGKLHPDCDPVPPDRPELRQSGQPGGCAPLSDRPEAVLAESSAYSREVGRLKGGGGPCHTQNNKRAAGPRLVYIMYVRNIPCVFVRLQLMRVRPRAASPNCLFHESRRAARSGRRARQGSSRDDHLLCVGCASLQGGG